MSTTALFLADYNHRTPKMQNTNQGHESRNAVLT